MSKDVNITRSENSLLELPYATPTLEALRRTGDSVLMLGVMEMGKILQGDVEVPPESKKSVSELKIQAFNSIVNANKYILSRSAMDSQNDELEDDIS